MYEKHYIHIYIHAYIYRVIICDVSDIRLFQKILYPADTIYLAGYFDWILKWIS